jgi:hypothetical protein
MNMTHDSEYIQELHEWIRFVCNQIWILVDTVHGRGFEVFRVTHVKTLQLIKRVVHL